MKGDNPGWFAWLRNGSFLYQDYDILHFLNASFQEQYQIQGPRNGYGYWSTSKDEKTILCPEPNSDLAIFNLGTGKCLGHKFLVHMSHAEWNPDDHSIIVSIFNEKPRLLPFSRNSFPPITGALPGNPWESIADVSTLEECFAQFEKELTPAELKRYRNYAFDRLGAFGGGSIITESMMSDHWTRWGKLRLQQFFRTKGITDERDEFGITLSCFWRHLHLQPLKLDEEISWHKNWWERGRPVIEENRSLPSEISQAQLKLRNGKTTTIASLAGKAKVVAFVDQACTASSWAIESLTGLIKKYKSGEVSVVTVSFTNEIMGYRSDAVDSVPESRQKYLDILTDTKSAPWIADGTQSVHDALMSFIRPLYYSFPQVLILDSNDKVLYRLNSSHSDKSVFEEDLESRVEEALKSVANR